MNIIVVGEEKLVFYLMRVFLSKGHRITVINRNEEACRQLASKQKNLVIHGDGSNPRVLEEAGAYSADALLAVTPRDQDNLLMCQLAVRRFHIPRILALANDPKNEEIFRDLGITEVFSPTKIMADLIEQKTGFDSIIDLIPLEEGKIALAEVLLEENAPSLGEALGELHFPDQALIAAIIRKGNPIVPKGSTVLLAGDRLILITLPEVLGSAIRILTETD